MKISYNWLKEYIDIKKSPAELADILTRSGSEVKTIERPGGDSVMDLEITPNRSDCLSYVGIAREISGLTGKSVKMPAAEIKKQRSSAKTPFTVEIKDRGLCHRYTARLIKDVRVGGSPAWLKERIISMGLRPVNNVVDITNLVLFELGQPMHAFDYDRIEGKAVEIRRARAGEKIVSIDNIQRKLEEDMLVIADGKRAIAVGGVMGGLDTEVTGKTKNVLLESAYFDPASVRRTSFKLALISESSYRFERGVDPEMVLGASNRAALLIKEICGGEITVLADKGTLRPAKKTISLTLARLNKTLNLDLKEAYVKKVFTALGLETSAKKTGKGACFTVLVPSFRQDIKGEMDLIEEVARIYGYENITATIPRIVPGLERKSISWKAKEKAATVLTSFGFNEVITYAMQSRSSIGKALGSGAGSMIAVENYLSFDQEIMRPSLVPGILNVLSRNINRGINDLKIFEIGGVYRRGPASKHSEGTNICIAMTGFSSGGWRGQKNEATFFTLKGALEGIFRQLGLQDFTISGQAVPFLSKEESSGIYYAGRCIGSMGRLVHGIEETYDLKGKAFIAEIDFDALIPGINLEKAFADIPKYPSVKRDISLVAGKGVSFEKIASLVKEKGGELVEKVELFDKYSGKQIPLGHYGISIRVEYRDRKKTLASRDVDKVHSAIRESLVKTFRVTLR